MTITELIEVLRLLPQDLIVGIDSVGPGGLMARYVVVDTAFFAAGHEPPGYRHGRMGCVIIERS